MDPIFLADFYKFSHREQYPSDTEYVWSNWTPRSSRVDGVTEIVHLGLQYFIKRYLQKEFTENFFKQPLAQVIAEYKEVLRATLGIADPPTDHIEWLHALGYLPIKIYSIPEGDRTPIGCPSMVITNTHPKGFWLPNFLETILSNILWMPSTSATTALRYRRIFEGYARVAGEEDLSFVDWQGHDFSMRGMSGVESAQLSGFGHLTCFSGTDSLPAILFAKKYYGAALSCGGSVPATEHSVMCAGTQEDELETFRRLITEVYPSGIVSIVSDTWDLWKVVTEFVSRLKDQILARDGKVVIRPDSGKPDLIMCGDPNSTDPRVAAGVLGCLKAVMGTTEPRPGALPMIRGMGAIYGDSITPEIAHKILGRCIGQHQLSPFNCVFGIGSYTYQHVTRDIYGFAMKATAVQRSGVVIPIFKKPITDNGLKTSLKGIAAVFQPDENTKQWPRYYAVDGYTDPKVLDNCAFQKVFEDGTLLVESTMDQIRKRVRAI